MVWPLAKCQCTDFFIFTKDAKPGQQVLVSVRQLYQSLKNTSWWNCADWQFWIFISIPAPKNFTSLSVSLPSNPFIVGFFQLLTLGCYMKSVLQLAVGDKLPLKDRMISSPNGNNPLVIVRPSDICHMSRMTQIFFKFCSYNKKKNLSRYLWNKCFRSTSENQIKEPTENSV